MTADHIELAFDVTIYDPADTVDGRRADGALPARPALHPGQRGRVRRATARASPSPPTAGPTRSCATFAAGHRPAADRGDAAAARARRRARAPDARARRASTARGRARSGVVLTHFSDELDVDWARAEGARGLRRAGRRGPRRCHLRARASKDLAASADPRVVTLATAAMDGVRLLSHRPSVLYKVEHLASEPAAGDIGVEGLLLAGPGWDERLKSVIKALSISERACLFAVRLADEQGLPVPAETLLDRTRTDWFPEFLSHGQMKPHFQPIVELHRRARLRPRGADARHARHGRAARRRADRRRRGPRRALLLRLPRPHRGARGRPAAAARPARSCSSTSTRARSLDVESSMRTTWPIVGRLGADPSRICLEIIKPERCPDRELLQDMVAEHRKRGALVALDDLSGGPDSLACLELLRPDIAKIDTALTAGIQHSPARRALVKALVDCAHELGAKVVAEGVERVDEFRAMAELGVDLGQGFYFGQPTETPDGGRHPPRAPQRVLSRLGAPNGSAHGTGRHARLRQARRRRGPGRRDPRSRLHGDRRPQRVRQVDAAACARAHAQAAPGRGPARRPRDRQAAEQGGRAAARAARAVRDRPRRDQRGRPGRPRPPSAPELPAAVVARGRARRPARDGSPRA